MPLCMLVTSNTSSTWTSKEVRYLIGTSAIYALIKTCLHYLTLNRPAK